MALFVLSLCPFDISVGVGAFVIGLSQISSFFSWTLGERIIVKYFTWSRITDESSITEMSVFHTLIRSNNRKGHRSYKRSRKGSDSVLWQKPLYPQNNLKSKVTTQKRHKTSITQRLRTDFGWSVGVTTATPLMWLSRCTSAQPFKPQQPCKQNDTNLKICK